MSITKYKAFCKIAELGNLTKAAEQLGYSQPGLSHMINSLEEEFGFTILNRNKDECTLTANGREILCYCNQIIQNESYLRNTVQSMNGLLIGNISISSINSMLINVVPKLVRQFSSMYSNIDIRLKESTYNDVIEEVKTGQADLGFTNSSTQKNIEFIPLINDPVCLIMPLNHPFSLYRKIPVEVVNGCDFIMPLPGFDDVMKVITDKVPIKPNVKYYVGSDIAAIGLVSNGLGISVMSKRQTNLLPHTVEVREFTADFHRTLGIAVKSLKHLSPATRAFIEHAKTYVATGRC